MEKMLTVAQLASILQVHPITVRRWMKDGLPFIRIGKSIRFNVEDVNSWTGRGK